MNAYVTRIAARVKELADQTLTELRYQYPVETDTHTECIRYCKDNKLTRGEIIEAIIIEEFTESETDLTA